MSPTNDFGHTLQEIMRNINHKEYMKKYNNQFTYPLNNAEIKNNLTGGNQYSKAIDFFISNRSLENQRIVNQFNALDFS